MLITSQREMIFITLLAHQEKLPKLENFSKKEFWKMLYILGRALFLKVIFFGYNHVGDIEILATEL